MKAEKLERLTPPGKVEAVFPKKVTSLLNLPFSECLLCVVSTIPGSMLQQLCGLGINIHGVRMSIQQRLRGLLEV